MGDRRRILVTGGAGFIGSHLVDHLLERPSVDVTVLDKLTYAGTRVNLTEHDGDPRLTFVLGDVAEADTVLPLVEQVDHVVHGATAAEGLFDEGDPFRPRSPYAASKAGADLLCHAYVVTYGTHVATVRGTNTFGPRQHPEKAIPRFVLAALAEHPVPVYGRGEQRREWLYVRDFVRAIATVMESGEPGGAYNIGGGHELTNLDLARQVCAYVGAEHSLISFVPDRPGHDFRYGVKWDRLARLGWSPATSFEDGLAITVAWYREHRDWVEAILQGSPAR